MRQSIAHHVILLFAILSCSGEIKAKAKPELPIQIPTGTTDSGSPIDLTDAGAMKAECVNPGIQPVTKVLRTSNFEYQQMLTDVLHFEVGDEYFVRFTPIAQVFGFDTMSESRIDSLGLQEQLVTGEKLATKWITSRQFAAQCPPLPAPETPLCTVKASYDSAADFSAVQNQNCWSYRDSTGAPLQYDPTNSRWRKVPDIGLYIWNNGMHPGSPINVVRRFTAPVDGSIDVNGLFRDADVTAGDGITVFINKNTRELWRAVIANRGEDTFALKVSVKRGDFIDFIVNQTGTPSYDSTAFNATIGFTVAPVTTNWTWANCARDAASDLASRAFRRPLRQEELYDYQLLFTKTLLDAETAELASPFTEAFMAVIQSIVVSPNVLFKPELVPNGFDVDEKNFAIASKLGLYFRSSVADETLWSLAKQGGLLDENVVRAQATRLLATNTDRFTKHFGGQWLDYRVSEVTSDPLFVSMQQEPSNIFSEILGNGLPAEKLLSPGFTFVDSRLAAHYGLTNYVAGFGGIQRVATSQRGGLLSQGAFLTRTAVGTEFSRPIHRGLWTLTRLMCQQLPRLDAATLEEIGTSLGTIDRMLPLSEQMKLHRNSASRCSGCHSKMDPIGLALEKYDQRGLWRDRYTNGALIENDFAFEGTQVRNPTELSALIEASATYRNCVATKLLTYALNRGPLDSEMCVAEQVARPEDASVPALNTMAVEAFMKSLSLTGLHP